MKVLTVELVGNGLSFTAHVEGQDGSIEPYTSLTAHGALFGIAHRVRELAEAATPEHPYREEVQR